MNPFPLLIKLVVLGTTVGTRDCFKLSFCWPFSQDLFACLIRQHHFDTPYLLDSPIRKVKMWNYGNGGEWHNDNFLAHLCATWTFRWVLCVYWGVTIPILCGHVPVEESNSHTPSPPLKCHQAIGSFLITINQCLLQVQVMHIVDWDSKFCIRRSILMSHRSTSVFLSTLGDSWILMYHRSIISLIHNLYQHWELKLEIKHLWLIIKHKISNLKARDCISNYTLR